MTSRRGVQHRVTVVGPDVDLEGDLVSRGLVEIHGRVRGNVRVDGRVVVCQEASCLSDISADSVEIAGLVQGDVRADTLLVHSTGKLRGTAFCRRRLIRKGGLIEPAVAPQAAAAVAASEKRKAASGVEAEGDVHVPCDAVPEVNALPGEVTPAPSPAPAASTQAPAAAPPALRRGRFIVSW